MAMGALGLLGVAGCGDVRPRAELDPPMVVASPSPSSAAPLPRGVRVDLSGEVHHARGLIRQLDGSYRTACVDAPGALRPAQAQARPIGHEERHR
jgi:hypothetical protein